MMVIMREVGPHYDHDSLKDCINSTYRQSAELSSCDTGKVCVQHTFGPLTTMLRNIFRCCDINACYHENCN